MQFKVKNYFETIILMQSTAKNDNVEFLDQNNRLYHEKEDYRVEIYSI